MPTEALTGLLLIASSFAATNFDNLALLVGWLLEGREGRRAVLHGHLLGMAALLALSLAFGFGANLVPVEYIGYCGVLPIALGLRGLYANFRAGSAPADERPASASTRSRPLSIAATQIANGVDTVLVFGPLLADSETGVDLVMIVGFFGMAIAWFQLARLLQTNAARLGVLERYGHWVAPIVLIVVGFYILADTATDVVPPV